MPPTLIPEEPEYDPFTYEMPRIEMSEQEPGDSGHEWLVIDLTEEEQERVLQAVSENVRFERNQLLLESDFFNYQ